MRTLLISSLGAVLLAACGLVARQAGRPPTRVDPARMAASETRMWQAYYSGNRLRLGYELLTLLRMQFGLGWGRAMRVARHLADAATNFRAARGHYEEAALDDLVAAYTQIRESAGLSYCPEAVARAELAWWVARRTPGSDSPEQVGRKIGVLYTLIYGREDELLIEAGLLRARAAALRDAGGRQADWAAVERLLHASYRRIDRMLNQASPRMESSHATARIPGHPSNLLPEHSSR